MSRQSHNKAAQSEYRRRRNLERFDEQLQEAYRQMRAVDLETEEKLKRIDELRHKIRVRINAADLESQEKLKRFVQEIYQQAVDLETQDGHRRFAKWSKRARDLSELLLSYSLEPKEAWPGGSGNSKEITSCEGNGAV